jgi:hypothetical protein
MKTSARVWQLLADKEEDRVKWLKWIEDNQTKKPPAPEVLNKGLRLSEVSPPDPRVQGTSPVDDTATSRHDDPASFEVAQVELVPGLVHIECSDASPVHIHEVRELELDGEHSCIVAGLARGFLPETLALRGVSQPLTVSQRTIFQNGTTQQQFLHSLVGQKLTASVPRGKAFEEAKSFAGVLSYDAPSSAYVLVDDDAGDIHFLNTDDPVTYQYSESPAVPPFLDSAVHYRFQDPGTNKAIASISYSAPESVTWGAVYNAVLSPKEDQLTLTSWIDFKNNTSKSYENAWVTVIHHPPAPEVKESAKDLIPIKLPFGKPKAPERKPVPPPTRTYSLADQLNLQPYGRTQLGFIQAQLPCVSLYLASFETPDYSPIREVVYLSADDGTKANAKVQSVIEFDNLPEHGLGGEWPTGRYRVSRVGKSGLGLESLSSGHSPHYSTGDRIRFSLEDLAGVTVSRTQTGFNFDPIKSLIVEQFEITVQNNRTDVVELTVEESLFRWHLWEITHTTLKFEPTRHPRRVQWKLHLPPFKNPTTWQYSVFYDQFYVAKSESK